MNAALFVWNRQMMNSYVKESFFRLVPTLIVETELAGEDAAEYLFHITNAPEDYLSPKDREILGNYHSKFPSMSVGDYALVGEQVFQCKGTGWLEVSKEIFESQKARQLSSMDRWNIL